MSAREGNSFVFPRDSMFPETKSRETLSFKGKQNYFPREQTLSVLLYSDEIKIKNIFIQQLYFVIKQYKVSDFKIYPQHFLCLLCVFVSFKFCSL